MSNSSGRLQEDLAHFVLIIRTSPSQTKPRTCPSDGISNARAVCSPVTLTALSRVLIKGNPSVVHGEAIVKQSQSVRGYLAQLVEAAVGDH